MSKESLQFTTECGNEYEVYKDGVFYSKQSDDNGYATDIPKYLFDLRDFFKQSASMVKIPEKLAKAIWFSRDCKNTLDIEVDMPLYAHRPFDGSEFLIQSDEDFWFAWDGGLEFAIDIDYKDLIY